MTFEIRSFKLELQKSTKTMEGKNGKSKWFCSSRISSKIYLLLSKPKGKLGGNGKMKK